MEITRYAQDYEAYYESPRAAIGAIAVPGEYRHKTWIYVFVLIEFAVIAAIFFGFAVLLSIKGFTSAPLGVEFAEASMVAGLASAVMAFLSLVDLLSRRGPALKAFREGLEVRIVGPSRMIGVPSAPRLWRRGLAFLSGHSCRFPKLRVTWSSLVEVTVTRRAYFVPLLTIHWRNEVDGQVCCVKLSHYEIAAPVDRVARELMALAGDEQARSLLPIWEGAL